ncbi:MAG: RDD family protein [Actinobacteria bacterium]|nr:RDD family protein [Actinomycetota bacterium]
MDGIITPEAVVLELETAGVASRVWAGTVDLGIQILLLVFLSGVLAAAGATSGSDVDTAMAIAVAVVLMGYPVVFETLLRGRTPGKRVFGLRAVTLEGAPIRLRHAVLRMMGGLVDRFLPPLGVTGTLMVLGTARHQRVGDLMAGTIVIRDPDRTRLPPAVWFPVPPGYEQFAASIDPTALTDAQYTVVRSFLMRNRELTPEARYRLAVDLAERVAERVHLPWTPAIHPEAYLLCVIARYQRRTFPQYQPTVWRS